MGEQMCEVAANLKKCREILAFASAVCRAESYLVNILVKLLHSSYTAMCEPTALEHLWLKFVTS